jgi:hypothetical protein
MDLSSNAHAAPNGGQQTSLTAELDALRALATRVEATRNAGATADDEILSFIDVYRTADRVRTAQVLPTGGEDPERLAGRKIYKTVNEKGGQDHSSYVSLNGRWRVAATAKGDWALQRFFGGTWQKRPMTPWRLVTEHLLVLDYGRFGTNQLAFDRALRLDLQATLWPPAHLADEYSLFVRPRQSEWPRLETDVRPFVTLEWDGEVEVFRVSVADAAADEGVTMLDPASPLGRALGDARQGASISWASPGGPPQTADVLRVDDMPPPPSGSAG